MNGSELGVRKPDRYMIGKIKSFMTQSNSLPSTVGKFVRDIRYYVVNISINGYSRWKPC